MKITSLIKTIKKARHFLYAEFSLTTIIWERIKKATEGYESTEMLLRPLPRRNKQQF